MPLIPKENVSDVFEEIKARYNQFKSCVLIVSASDCDSICATRILASMFQTEHISYSTHPVQSYRHIDAINNDLIQPKLLSNELNSLILINCGSMINLIEFLFLAPIETQKRMEFEARKESLMIEKGEFYDEYSEQMQFDSELQDYLDNIELPNCDEFRIYVMDSHRPFHLQNVYDSNNIVFLLQGDDEIPLNDLPDINELQQLAIKESQLLNQNNENENIFDNDDSNNNNDINHNSINNVLNKHNININNIDNSDNDDNKSNDSDFEEEDNDLDGTNSPPRKRRKLNNTNNANNNSNNNDLSLSIAMEKRSKEREIRNYYRYSYFALHSSGIAYDMAIGTHKDDNGLLWMALLGLTDQFVHEKISREQYNIAVIKYKDYVTRLNSHLINNNNDNNNNNNINNNINNDSTIIDSYASYSHNEQNIEDSKIVHHRSHGHIAFSEEFRFTLMRFWTLYDSMYYSRYIATKLGVWTDVGKERLKYLMAKMALPLSEATQPFTNMRREYKNKLFELFESHSEEFSLDSDIRYGSFTKQHGSLHSISCSDMVYALTAVLEADFAVFKKNNISHSSNSNNNSNNNDLNDKNESNLNNINNELTNKVMIDAIWQSNFWTSYDSMSVSLENQNLLEMAIELAKDRQKEIVDMGTKLIEKKVIKSLDVMRYCVIDTKNRFQSPMLLVKLALFIIDAFRQHSKRKRGRPKAFVLGSFNDLNNSFIVVGIPSKEDSGDVQKSPFGIAFQQATQQVNARVFHDSFEGSVMEVQKDDFKDWLETLHQNLVDCII